MGHNFRFPVQLIDKVPQKRQQHLVGESVMELHSDGCIVSGSVWVPVRVRPPVGVSSTTSTQAFVLRHIQMMDNQLMLTIPNELLPQGQNSGLFLPPS